VDVVAIKRLLPHRYPLLLLDRVTEVTDGNCLRAFKAVTAAEPCFAGVADDADHTYPHMLVLESWCQAAAVLVCLGNGTGDDPPLPVLGGLRDVALRANARPGDVLEHRVRLVRVVGANAIVEGATTVVGGHEIMSVSGVTVSLRSAHTMAGPTDGRHT
jgi:3-hydroxyacyl-[acyl-carrier-protein] dehydratase